MSTLLQSFYIIRFNDCDPFGHLNNSRYIDYMLNAREDHIRNAYQIELHTSAKNGVGWVVNKHEIRYIRPAFYNEKVCIQSDVIEGGESELILEMIMFDEHKRNIKAVLWTNFTHINLKTGRREIHSPDFQQLLLNVRNDKVNVNEGLDNRVKELLHMCKTEQEV